MPGGWMPARAEGPPFIRLCAAAKTPTTTATASWTPRNAIKMRSAHFAPKTGGARGGGTAVDSSWCPSVILGFPGPLLPR